MKILKSLVLFLAFLNSSPAQIIILQEDFTNYMATTQSTPAGWIFSYQGNYTTTTFSGTSGPNAYKFGGTTTTTINTPPFSPGVDSVKFWIKGSGTDSVSKLVVLESADSLSWDTLTTVCPLPTMAAKGKKTFPVQATSTHLRFKYIKSAGNLAFDDFKLIEMPPVANFTADMTSGCNPVCVKFTDQSTPGVTKWTWDFGDGGTSSNPNPIYCYMKPGNYTVKLTVDSGGLTNTVTKTNYINSYPIPSASFSLSPQITNLANSLITFTNTSTGGTTWLWNFGDGKTSALMNPTHTYTDTGYFCPWLTATSAFGCKDSLSNCVRIKPVIAGIEETNESSDFSVFPNPAVGGHFKVQLTPANSTGIITISNVLGEVVKTISAIQATENVDLSEMTPGIYFVNVKQGSLSGTKKIVVD